MEGGACALRPAGKVTDEWLDSPVLSIKTKVSSALRGKNTYKYLDHHPLSNYGSIGTSMLFL